MFATDPRSSVYVVKIFGSSLSAGLVSGAAGNAWTGRHAQIPVIILLCHHIYTTVYSAYAITTTKVPSLLGTLLELLHAPETLGLVSSKGHNKEHLD